MRDDLLTKLQRPEQNETSIALVSRNHTLLQLPSLEAEASGLLDRLLGVFQEYQRYERICEVFYTLVTVSVTPSLSMRP